MKKSELAVEIRYELDCLGRVAQAAEVLFREKRSDKSPWPAAAAAKYISDVFMGLENLWKRKCRYRGESFPEGATSHRDVLAAFLEDPSLGRRLAPETAEHLAGYLRFRHRFIHGYGYEVTWEMVEKPLELIPQTVAEMTRVWEQWLKETPE